MGLEAMLSIGQNPEKTSLDGEKKPCTLRSFFCKYQLTPFLQYQVSSHTGITRKYLLIYSIYGHCLAC